MIERRPLAHFERLDDAGKSPLGGPKCSSEGTGPFYDIQLKPTPHAFSGLGAFLTLLFLAVSPFAHQAVSINHRRVEKAPATVESRRITLDAKEMSPIILTCKRRFAITH